LKVLPSPFDIAQKNENNPILGNKRKKLLISMTPYDAIYSEQPDI